MPKSPTNSDINTYNVEQLKELIKEGNNYARARLGRIYYYGNNKQEGEQLLIEAAKINDTPGLWAKGVCCMDGIGRRICYSLATNYLLVASQREYAPAYCSTGDYYIKLIQSANALTEEESVAFLNQALECFDKAKALGDEFAKEKLDKLMEELQNNIHVNIAPSA